MISLLLNLSFEDFKYVRILLGHRKLSVVRGVYIRKVPRRRGATVLRIDFVRGFH